MTMQNSKELLGSILKTAQRGQTGIRSVMDTAMAPNLRTALVRQLREYDAIESEAHRMASQRGWEIRELEPAARFFADRMTRIKLTGQDTDSRIAGILIQDSTRGIIRELKNLHGFTGRDDGLRVLSQKLLDCENAGIRQLQSFL